MDNPEFPPNSDASKREPEEKKINPIVSGGVTRKKKSLRRQFADTFVEGDTKTATRYVILDVMLPWTKDMVFEVGTEFLRKLMFGNRGGRRGATPPYSGTQGPTPYYQQYAPSVQQFGSGIMNRAFQNAPQRVLSRQARTSHAFDEIVLNVRIEAEQVIDQLFELVNQYGQASVADLYELVGVVATHTDNKWGWTNLAGAGVTMVRGGYLLDLPQPVPLG